VDRISISGHGHGRSRLSRRLLVLILLVSTFCTLLGTGIQLYFDYQKDMGSLLAQIEQIRASRLPSLANALWYLDESQIYEQLNGIVALPDIKYAQVNTPDGLDFFRGTAGPPEQMIIRSFPLLYHSQNREDRIGVLTVAVDSGAVNSQVQRKILLILVNQGVQIFLVSIFILYILYRLVTRHLQRMAEYASGLTVDRLTQPLVLDKDSSDKPDELDLVANAFNAMRENLLRDIRHRVDAENKLKHAENYIRNILDSMPSILISVDLEGRITHWNQQAEMKTGVSQNEAVGGLFEMVYVGAPVTLEQILSAISSRTPVRTSKVPQKRGDAFVYYDVTVYPLGSTGVLGAVIRIDDVSDRVRMEETMIQSEKMLSVGGLAAGMAHEINNPLAGILQNVQVLRNRISGELLVNRNTAQELGFTIEQLQEYFERRGGYRMIDSIMESGMRAAKIVENMLSFSRKGNTEMAPVNICDLLDRTVELASNDYDLKREYDFRKISIVREYAQDLPMVPCEESKLQQVFYNLIRNGAQAMSEYKGNDARLILRAYPHDEFVRVEIEDNGPGMSEDVRKRIFEPFFTTKKVGVGTGLGLSVSYFIVVENHGGQMEVKSSPGAGTAFQVTLPLNQHAQPEGVAM